MRPCNDYPPAGKQMFLSSQGGAKSKERRAKVRISYSQGLQGGDKEFLEKVLPPKLWDEVCTVKSILIKLRNMSHHILRNRSSD